MEVTTAAQARAWLAAWGGRPRRGILGKVLEGTRQIISYAVEYRHPQMEKDARECLAVLERAWKELGYGER